MINPKFIKEFLSRPLDNYDWIKACSVSQLDEALRELAPVPDFGTVKLWAHQKACFLITHEVQRFMLHLDMGAGKTLITLMLLRHQKRCGKQIKAIVFVPYITGVETWVEEVEKHAPDLKCVPLLGTTADNFSKLDTEGDIFVICYQSAVAMISERFPGKKKKWNFKAKDVRDYFSSFNMLVMDEVHKTKNVSSLAYRMCRAISSRCDWVLGLTGTPFGRDLTDLWPQFYLIDFGDTLGPTLGFYQEVFFENKRGYWGGFDHKFKQKMLPDLKEMIKNRSIAYAIDELHDMPALNYVTHGLTQPEAALSYCEVALKRIKEAAGKTGNYQVVESNYLQLRQLASGFMTLKGEDNNRLQIKFEDNPKLDLLQELIEAIPAGRKFVIFHHFIYTNQLISDRLKQMKIKHARIWSGQRDPIGELRKFKQDPNCLGLVLNSKSGSSSLNLQIANYVFFFEQPDSAIDRQQAERRCWRPGQERRVWIHDMLMKGTMDKRLHTANKAGENLLKLLLRGR